MGEGRVYGGVGGAEGSDGVVGELGDESDSNGMACMGKRIGRTLQGQIGTRRAEVIGD